MSVTPEEPRQPEQPEQPAQPEARKFRPGFLVQLEEQRRQRRIEALQKRFDATIQHIDQVERVNEECYRRQMEVTQAARTGASSQPPASGAFPPPVAMPPQTPPPSSVFRKPWIRNLLRPPAPPAPKPAVPPKPAAKAARKAKRKK